MSVHVALKWSFLGELASKTITPIVFVILARLLTPADYGVVAAATIVISFSQMFWDAGMAKAIIQYQGDRTAAANAAFWINMILGSVVATALVMGAGFISDRIFHDPRVETVLQVMAMQVLLSASVSVHIALLQKDLNFKRLFWIKLATVAIPGLASIPLALYGMGYWALVAGGLVGQFFQVLFMWISSPWRPNFLFDVDIARQLGRFGGWVALTGLLGWFYIWVDSLIVGIFLGSHELGLYRTGNAFVTMVFGLFFGPLMPVLYSHLSGISRDRELIRETMIRVIKILTFISIPLAAIIAFNASMISDLVFGGKWQGVDLVIMSLALMNGIAWVVGANGEAYRAVGAPSNETKITSIALIFYIMGYLTSIQYSFEAFIWTRLSLAVAATAIHFWVLKKKLSIQIFPVLRYVLAIIAISAITIAPALLLPLEKTEFGRIPQALVMMATVITALLVFERKDLVPQLFGIARKAFQR